jgi:hypothetical protein
MLAASPSAQCTRRRRIFQRQVDKLSMNLDPDGLGRGLIWSPRERAGEQRGELSCHRIGRNPLENSVVRILFKAVSDLSVVSWQMSCLSYDLSSLSWFVFKAS